MLKFINKPMFSISDLRLFLQNLCKDLDGRYINIEKIVEKVKSIYVM